MKIVVIAFGPLSKPQISGYLMRTRMIVDGLAQHNDVTILEFTASDGEYQLPSGANVISLEVGHEKAGGKGGLGFNLFAELRFQIEGRAKLHKYIHLIRSADQVYIEGCLLRQGFKVAKKEKKYIVLDTHCINREVAEKLKPSNLVAGTLRSIIWNQIEKSMMNASDELIFVSEHDQKIAEEYYGLSGVEKTITENAVEPADYERHKLEAETIRRKFKIGDKKVAVYLGNLGAIQNKEAADYIANVLAPATPNIHYVLVGANPDNRRDKSNVTHTGFVERFDPYIIMSDVCIAPLKIGSGTKTKMLDYMKYGKRIIATPVGSEGIEVDSYNNMQVVDIESFINTMKEYSS